MKKNVLLITGLTLALMNASHSASSVATMKLTPGTHKKNKISAKHITSKQQYAYTDFSGNWVIERCTGNHVDDNPNKIFHIESTPSSLRVDDEYLQINNIETKQSASRYFSSNEMSILKWSIDKTSLILRSNYTGVVFDNYEQPDGFQVSYEDEQVTYALVNEQLIVRYENQQDPSLNATCYLKKTD